MNEDVKWAITFRRKEKRRPSFPDFGFVRRESLSPRPPFSTHFREAISFLVLDFGKLKVEEFVRGILNTNYRLTL